MNLALRPLLLFASALSLPLASGVGQPTVKIDPPQLQGSRPVEKQTEAAVIRDYLQSWKSLQAALDQNRPDLLNADFVGTARDKLAATVEEQAKMSIHTRYIDRSHELQIVFYSPEGLSLQLTDIVEYDEQVLDHDKLLASKPIRLRYLVVLTPAEVRWRVRLFQAQANADRLKSGQ